MTDVKGNCPMGCGQTLVLVRQGWRRKGWIACSAPDCPKPDAVHVFLQDLATGHIVTFGEDSFAIQHPLRERLLGVMGHECACHQYVQTLARPPVPPGHYRAVPLDSDASPSRWAFTPVA